MPLPLSALTLGTLFALALFCADHGGARLFGALAPVTLLGALTLRAALARPLRVRLPARRVDRPQGPACP